MSVSYSLKLAHVIVILFLRLLVLDWGHSMSCRLYSGSPLVHFDIANPIRLYEVKIGSPPQDSLIDGSRGRACISCFLVIFVFQALHWILICTVLMFLLGGILVLAASVRESARDTFQWDHPCCGSSLLCCLGSLVHRILLCVIVSKFSWFCLSASLHPFCLPLTDLLSESFFF